MKKIHKIGIGFLIGLISNSIGVVIYMLLFTHENLLLGLKTAYENNFIGSIITIGALPNLLVFMKFLNLNKIYQARGVVFATFLSAFLMIYLKWF